MPDGRLIDVTSGTKHAALEALYRKHQTMLLRLAWLLTGNRLDAEDLVQAVFLRYSRIDQPPANPKASLRTMVVNAARDLGREHGRESPSQIVPDGISNSPEVSEIWDAIQELPDDQRVVLILRYHDDLSHEEISQILDCPIGTVRSRISRGLARLREGMS